MAFQSTVLITADDVVWSVIREGSFVLFHLHTHCRVDVKICMILLHLQLWQWWQTGGVGLRICWWYSGAGWNPSFRQRRRWLHCAAATFLDLRKRYLTWIFPQVSIAHRRRRRRICDSEEQRSFKKRLVWFSWHSREEPCSDRAIPTTPHWRCYRLLAACKPPNLSRVLSVAPRRFDGSNLAGDCPSWRRSVSHYSGDPSCSGSAQLSDDCDAHARWPSLGSQGKVSESMQLKKCSKPWHQSQQRHQKCVYMYIYILYIWLIYTTAGLKTV